MSDDNDKIVKLPKPDEVKARLFPGADGDRPDSPTPKQGNDAGPPPEAMRALFFAAAEGARPSSPPPENPGAEAYPPAEGGRPTSPTPDVDAPASGQAEVDADK
jgi:hypothetical protein